MDHHLRSAITQGLRQREVDVITAFEDESNELDDPDLLDRATQLGRAFVTNDEDLLVEAARRQRVGISFGGVIRVDQERIPIGECIRDLEIIAKAGQQGDIENRVLFLPL